MLYVYLILIILLGVFIISSNKCANKCTRTTVLKVPYEMRDYMRVKTESPVKSPLTVHDRSPENDVGLEMSEYKIQKRKRSHREGFTIPVLNTSSRRNQIPSIEKIKRS